VESSHRCYAKAARRESRVVAKPAQRRSTVANQHGGRETDIFACGNPDHTRDHFLKNKLANAVYAAAPA